MRAVAERWVPITGGMHTHAENIVYHAKAENFLRMGVTTLVLGNCGSSKLDIGKFFTLATVRTCYLCRLGQSL